MPAPSMSLNDHKAVDRKAGAKAGTKATPRKALFSQLYRLFRAPTGEVVRVKVGFSWSAFFVGSMSALFKRAWLLLVALATLYMVVSYQGGAPLESSRASAIGIVLLGFYAAYMLFCGINGNRWLVESLRRRGYILIGEERS
jgi:hypothetical protein